MTDRGSILVVDDMHASLKLLTDILVGAGFDVRPADSGGLALASASAKPPALILLDVKMPGMDGFEVCRRLKEDERLSDIPVLFISSLNDMNDKLFAFNAGGQDYITKPFQAEEVLARVHTHMKIRHLQTELEQYNRLLEQRVAEQVKDISDSQIATIISLAKLSESRDDDTGRHIERVQTFCRLLAEKMAEQPSYREAITSAFIENVFLASSLHDVGKVGISDKILLKPGKLTAEEFEIMKTHTVIGWRTLAVTQEKYPKNILMTTAICIAHYHHERWDGNGYPDGLKGEKIPLEARIMAVADAYDALRSKRVYKQAFSHDQSRAILLEGNGTQFAPDVVDAFVVLEERCDCSWSQMWDSGKGPQPEEHVI
jgi:putative two-component system response regulator